MWKGHFNASPRGLVSLNFIYPWQKVVKPKSKLKVVENVLIETEAYDPSYVTNGGQGTNNAEHIIENQTELEGNVSIEGQETNNMEVKSINLLNLFLALYFI